MTLVEVVWTNNSDAGLATLKQFNYVNGAYTSPLQSNFFIFASGTGNPLVSYYLVTNGFEGQGPIPVAGSTMTLKINETFPWVSFVFDPLSDKFRYARTNVLYGNNDIDMQALLAASTVATPITTPLPNVYAADFIVPPSASGQYLYIIWDLRQQYGVQLCYGETIEDVCCNCEPCLEECSQYVFFNPEGATQNAVVEFPFGSCFSPETFTQTILPGETYSFCLPNDKNNYIIMEGNPVAYMSSCFCEEVSLLLDEYPGAAAAYSVRKLKTSYTGAALRVRRSSDNVEQDIYFDSSGDLDTTSLMSFVGVNSGFVTTWYDQSGNGHDSVQITAANQPRIVNAGVLETLSGIGPSRPAIYFDGINDSFAHTASITSGESTFIMSTKPQNITGIYYFGLIASPASTPVLNNIIFSYDQWGTFFNIGQTGLSTYPISNVYRLLCSYSNGIINVGASNTLITDDNPPENVTTSNRYTGDGNNRRYVGQWGTDVLFAQMHANEIIIYNTNELPNYPSISANINSYFNIYP